MIMRRDLMILQFRACNTDQVDISKFFQKNSDSNNQNDKLGPGFNEIKHECSGSRPWIGKNEHNCKAKQHVLLKGASNIYYPTIKSSIFIPVITEEFDKEILKKINNETFWNSIKDQNEEMLNRDSLAKKIEMNKAIKDVRKIGSDGYLAKAVTVHNLLASPAATAIIYNKGRLSPSSL